MEIIIKEKHLTEYVNKFCFRVKIKNNNKSYTFNYYSEVEPSNNHILEYIADIIMNIETYYIENPKIQNMYDNFVKLLSEVEIEELMNKYDYLFIG